MTPREKIDAIRRLLAWGIDHSTTTADLEHFLAVIQGILNGERPYK